MRKAEAGFLTKIRALTVAHCASLNPAALRAFGHLDFATEAPMNVAF
jgi:hypothetical protein